MTTIILRAIGFVGVIVACFLLKQVGIFKKEDGQVLARLMMNITMPCALLSAGENVSLSPLLLIAFGLGIVCNAALVILGAISAAPYGRKMQGIFALNSAGFNVGSFALPYGQYFFGSHVLPFLCMFDIGNAIMNLGVNNTTGSIIAGTGEKATVKGVMKRLFSQPPFSVYLIVIAFALLKIKMPSGLFTIVGIAGGANAFVAMAMIGLLLEVKMPKGDIGKIVRLLVGRYLLVFVMMGLIWKFFPAEADVRMILCLCLASPITSIAPVFSRDMIGESDIPAAANSLAIILSLILMTSLMVAFS